MPVESADLDEAAARYAQTLVDVAGSPPVLDLVHLGLGSDGHTASLVPGDPVLDVTDADVALTGVYQGRRRMTLTYPVLNRARRVLWLITGEDKAAMLVRLRRGDPAIPAGRVRQDHAVVLADRAAAAGGRSHDWTIRVHGRRSRRTCAGARVQRSGHACGHRHRSRRVRFEGGARHAPARRGPRDRGFRRLHA